MKKILVFPIAFLMLSLASFAQRYAVVDARYIMDKMPEYKLAQAQLDQTANNWQKEIDAMQRQLDSMYRNFEAEEMMLSQELIKKRKDELFNKEKAVRDLQRKRFGFEGDLFTERQKLVKPIQDKVYTAIQKIAVARSYDFILDKSEGITVIFADPKLDKSEDVLRELGVKPN
jgi:outer membrane protein